MLSQEVKELQDNAVNALLDKMSSVCNEFTFKAPTGSGKTFIGISQASFDKKNYQIPHLTV